MLTSKELKEYASIRGLSLRDIGAYCDVSTQYIGMIFNGDRPLTQEAHDQIVNGINAAYAAKKNGTFTRPSLDENRNMTKQKKQDGVGESKRAKREKT